ncbi:hypothetical protein [Corynebacterium aurimucosum]|uniref:Uncharacterized protein n=1 Tax=Corynebacterium aurimucosum (strain ATCC 700975 / DSM 44827 / CIP 107346 / CN-1) TaxID=548476 RepID=C3PFY8_CORA7|nr:hypothetical protein [Corynebacterium aurimucosum]ACP32742.1 hypothetical protein cauri_1149 [Corynebacterium aurimucosum ATCC 700975]QQU93090.1 hypothetical protein I6I67_13030 [Corynebacterium aurimucosum]
MPTWAPEFFYSVDDVLVDPVLAQPLGGALVATRITVHGGGDSPYGDGYT